MQEHERSPSDPMLAYPLVMVGDHSPIYFELPTVSVPAKITRSRLVCKDHDAAGEHGGEHRTWNVSMSR